MFAILTDIDNLYDIMAEKTYWHGFSNIVRKLIIINKNLNYETN
jgi:hypothetical protein